MTCTSASLSVIHRAEPRQARSVSADGLLVAGDGARGKDDEIALVERDVGMFVLGDPRDGRARLTLAAGAQAHDLVALQDREIAAGRGR